MGEVNAARGDEGQKLIYAKRETQICLFPMRGIEPRAAV
jgi:hypothetical protein